MAELNEVINKKPNGKKGTHLSEETKRKISEAMKNRKKSEETKKKISETMKGRKLTWLTYEFNEEHRKHISEAKKGLKHTEETKKKMSEAKMGHAVSLRIIDNLVEYNHNRKGILQGPHTWERRVHISESMFDWHYLTDLTEKLQIKKDIENLYGISMGLNDKYKKWHKPLAEGKSATHLGYYVPRLHPEKCLSRGQNIFRSGWEAIFFDWCDRSSEVISWASEPIAIQYRHPTANLEYCIKHNLNPNDPRFLKIQNYYMDVWMVLKYMNGTEVKTKKVFVEIKPYSQSVPPTPILPNASLKEHKAFNRQAETYLINKAKWEAATKFCAEHDCEFWVATEKIWFNLTTGTEIERKVKFT